MVDEGGGACSGGCEMMGEDGYEMLPDYNGSEVDSSSSVLLLFRPTLEEIREGLRWGLPLHVYTFACLFFFLSFYSFFSILNLRSQLYSRPYMTTINSLLCLLGASRSAVLFIDPYGLEERLPPLLRNLLWDFSFPSLLSSFTLVQIVFTQLSQMGEEREEDCEDFRKKMLLALVITLHFLSVVVSSTFPNSNEHLMVGKMVTQGVFCSWGLLLCGSFLVKGRLLSSATPNRPNDKGIANLFGMGMMGGGGGGGGGQNLASSLTAALAPTLLQAPNSPALPNITVSPVAEEEEEEEEMTLHSIPEGGSPPAPPPTAARPTSLACGGIEVDGAASTSTSASSHVRPPSPVLPRRKSSGPGLRGGRLGWRRESGGEGGGSLQEEGRKDNRKKSLSWCEESLMEGSGRKSLDNSSGSGQRKESLVGAATATGPDYTLQSILSHIAYVNQTALDYRLSRKLSGSGQVDKILKNTYTTAVLGGLLCVGEMIRLLGPYGLCYLEEGAGQEVVGGPWFWFSLETINRCVEFSMGANLASITKHSTPRPFHYGIRGHRESSLYL